jgi:SAM-dependent methyltransferase
MGVTHETNDEQAKLWKGIGGQGWVEAQPVLDQMFRPFEDLLVEAVADGSRRQVLDVGCGTGSTTLALARVVGAGGRSVGVDISDPMIAAARARAERERLPATFICASAEDYAFEPAAFDTVVSRFGVMFFADPVRAFSNLRHAAIAGGALRFIAWRSASENPFMTTAEHAAAPLLPDLPARRPDAPGQFAFADGQRIRTILEDSGWADIDVRPIDVVCTIAEKDLDLYLMRIGPLARILQEVDDQTRERIFETVRAAFNPYVQGTEVRFNAACWTVGARA